MFKSRNNLVAETMTNPNNNIQLDFFIQAAKKLDVTLSAKAVSLFHIYFQELLAWNKKINLTRTTNKKEVFLNHFVDSLIPKKFIPPDSTVLDIGSGAGFPGIPLKIIRPDISVTLLDSSFKKTFFQRHIIRLLNLKGIVAIHERAENVRSINKSYDVCIGKAFAPLPVFLSTALPLKAPEGIIIAMKGPRFGDELARVESQSFQQKISIKQIKTFVLPYTNKKRAILVFG